MCALAAGLGAGSHATYNARTAADEPQYLITAMSIADDGDLDIADELAGQRWRAFHQSRLPEQTKPLPGGRRVSPHDPLLPLLLAAPMAAGGWLGAKLTLAAIAGLLGVAVTWVAVRRFGVAARTAALTAAVFGASAPLAVYGHQVYPEAAAALAVTIGVGALTGPLARRGVWMLGAAIVALPWLSVKYAPVAAALALLGCSRLWRGSAPGTRRRGGGRGAEPARGPQIDGRRGAALGFAGGLAAAGIVFLGLHQAVYGGWTAYAAGDHFVTGEFGVVGFHPNYLGRSQRLAGLLVDRKFGIAAWQPAWLFAVPAVAALLRARPQGWQALLAPIAAGYLTATFVALTAQGYWFGGRQIVVVLGCAAVAVAWLLDRARARWPLAASGLVGIASYAWLTVEATTRAHTIVVDVFGTANPLYRAWSRLLPDYAAPNAATWPLHAVWVAAFALLLWRGWVVGARADAAQPPEAQVTVKVVTMPSS